MRTSRWVVMGALLGGLALLPGCFLPSDLFKGGSSKQRSASSLVNYLYPQGMSAPDKPTIPTLALPLRVGLAWVPEGGDGPSHRRVEPLTEQQKIALLEQVAQRFKGYGFVNAIEVIPSTYLRPGGGFENLDQLRAMHNIDVMALVSYDQVQFNRQNVLAVTYVTVVGAYLIPGEDNQTQTMIDTAVYDIASRKLLFRAPGTSTVKGETTAFFQDAQLRNDSQRGFAVAATNMVENLDIQLASFRERVKQAPEEYKIVHRSGYTGGGDAGWGGALLACVLGVLAFARRRAGASQSNA